MPRSKIHCQSCLKEIAGTQKGDAKVVDAWTLERGYGRIFLHQECYDRENAEVKIHEVWDDLLADRSSLERK